MTHRTIQELAEPFGLTVEAVAIAENGTALRLYKGANQVFIGTEEAVRNFLDNYEKDRPGLYEGSIYGYRE